MMSRLRMDARQTGMDAQTGLLAAWRTSNRITTELIQALPPKVWTAEIPGVPRRTIRSIGAHLHNSRCSWIKTLGHEHGIGAPARVDRRSVTRRRLVAALKRSGTAMESLLALGLRHDGRLPPSKRYVWRNLDLDVSHVLTYFVAHEAHHRGQIVMVARQLGMRLPSTVNTNLWQWKPKS